MNAVEIEVAVSDLALQAFDRAEFAFAFLAAFGNKETTIKRLRKGESNASDVPGGILQRNNIHLAVCESGKGWRDAEGATREPSDRRRQGKVRPGHGRRNAGGGRPRQWRNHRRAGRFFILDRNHVRLHFTPKRRSRLARRAKSEQTGTVMRRLRATDPDILKLDGETNHGKRRIAQKAVPLLRSGR